MNIEYLTQLLDNKLKSLTNSKDQAFMIGDLAGVNTIDQEILGVQNTLYSLRLLESMNAVASSTNTTPSQIIESGIQAVSSNTYVQIDNPTGILLGYDISSYATDPLHEQKIADILGFIGAMNSPSDIDTYINNEAIQSPVTGQMIWNSSIQYSVDIRLMMAIMEQDSRFGTAGLAIKTLNPGNVGNDDSGNIKTFSSWQEGVDAVAEWLSKHRVNNTPEESPAPSETKVETTETPIDNPETVN